MRFRVKLKFGIGKKATKILAKLDEILDNQETIMSQNDDVLVYAARIDAATNELAADIKALLERETGLTDESKATLERVTSRLEVLGTEQ